MALKLRGLVAGLGTGLTSGIQSFRRQEESKRANQQRTIQMQALRQQMAPVMTTAAAINGIQEFKDNGVITEASSNRMTDARIKQFLDSSNPAQIQMGVNLAKKRRSGELQSGTIALSKFEAKLFQQSALGQQRGELQQQRFGQAKEREKRRERFKITSQKTRSNERQIERLQNQIDKALTAETKAPRSLGELTVKEGFPKKEKARRLNVNKQVLRKINSIIRIQESNRNITVNPELLRQRIDVQSTIQDLGGKVPTSNVKQPKKGTGIQGANVNPQSPEDVRSFAAQFGAQVEGVGGEQIVSPAQGAPREQIKTMMDAMAQGAKFRAPNGKVFEKIGSEKFTEVLG